ncbi:mucin-6-like [Stegostoma tigrinum]|uniref:mucin-6-like n=1 Tax=Stegostoma tigrinum TaxID=3053191 RepID=UPI0028700860|nr:mucin-6-like [Stegostoma tigrinum]
MSEHHEVLFSRQTPLNLALPKDVEQPIHTCVGAQWDCSDIQCPGTCSIEGGSFMTTFDERTYRFHGDCEYLLVGSSKMPRHGTIEAIFEQCGTTYTKTRLVSVIYATYEMKIVFSMDGKIEVNNQRKNLPFRTGNIKIYRCSSNYIQMNTNFGLDILFKVTEVFQVYITVGVMFYGSTSGLCGNFNGDSTDDFKSSMEITEGSPVYFVNSWRVTAHCGVAHDEDSDPCSLSQVNEMFAEVHCSALLKESSIFGQCHNYLDPIEFYKNCRFETCNYEQTNDFMCASLASYVSACAKRGVLLIGWRNSIEQCRISCPHNQTFSYDSRACNRTCLSLSDPNFECSAGDAPVDGCNCPEHTYLDDTGKCVSAAECPCFLAHVVIAHANEKINLYGGICVCENGNLKCTGQDPQEQCYPPKVYFNCENAQDGEYGAACAQTCQMLAAEGQCISVCGLCGNANGNIKDELITQSQHSAFTLMSFVNSWKEDPMCDDVTEVVYPCAKNPYRKSWAEKRCKIIHSALFQPCRNLLQWLPYYNNCIRDSCGCELVGDCDCLCDAVAAFAKACLDAGVCIDWRTPDFCRKF